MDPDGRSGLVLSRRGTMEKPGPLDVGILGDFGEKIACWRANDEIPVDVASSYRGNFVGGDVRSASDSTVFRWAGCLPGGLPATW